MVGELTITDFPDRRMLSVYVNGKCVGRCGTPIPTSLFEAVGRVALVLWERGMQGDVELRHFGGTRVFATFRMLAGPRALEVQRVWEAHERAWEAQVLATVRNEEDHKLDSVDYVNFGEWDDPPMEDFDVHYPPDEPDYWFDQDGNTIDEDGEPYDSS